MEECDMGTQSIGKLIVRFSVPCVISMLVAALYNIVDQIFIGWSEAGAYGNAATNIVYPFTVLALGLSLLVGDGGAALFSLALGEKNERKAERTVGNAIVLLASASALLTVFGFAFGKRILALFGANPEEALCYGYATEYFGIICTGLPFYMMGQGLNGTIRADGSPRYAMACTLAGAAANIVLDPVFIFLLGMGVRGAALATVIGQALTFLMSVAYLLRPRQFSLSRASLKPETRTAKRIALVGMASLIVQLSIVVIIGVNNNLLTRYGYETLASTGNAFGSVIPLAVVGIVMKVFGIVVSVVIGISLGGQPIIGFNRGAGNTERVRKTVGTISRLVLCVGAACFLVFELFPDAVIFLFGRNNTAEYTEYARLCIRIFLGGIVLTCYTKSAAIMLQSIGRSGASTFLALLRDVIAFVPASLIIAFVSRNIVTMLWSAPISDAVAFLASVALVRREMRRLDARTAR